MQQKERTAYNPRAKGAAEKTNATLNPKIKKFCNDDLAAWKDLINFIPLAMKPFIVPSNGSKPFTVMFARKNYTFAAFDKIYIDDITPTTVKNWDKNHQTMHNLVFSTLLIKIEADNKWSQTFSYKRRIVVADLPVGSYVLLREQTLWSKWKTRATGFIQIKRKNRASVHITEATRSSHDSTRSHNLFQTRKPSIMIPKCWHTACLISAATKSTANFLYHRNLQLALHGSHEQTFCQPVASTITDAICSVHYVCRGQYWYTCRGEFGSIEERIEASDRGWQAGWSEQAEEDEITLAHLQSVSLNSSGKKAEYKERVTLMTKGDQQNELFPV